MLPSYILHLTVLKALLLPLMTSLFLPRPCPLRAGRHGPAHPVTQTEWPGQAVRLVRQRLCSDGVQNPLGDRVAGRCAHLDLHIVYNTKVGGWLITADRVSCFLCEKET